GGARFFIFSLEVEEPLTSSAHHLIASSPAHAVRHPVSKPSSSPASAALATAPTNTKLVIHPPRTPGVDYLDKNVLLMPSGDLDLDPTRRKRLARSSEPKQGISRMTNLFGRALRLLAAVAMLAAACIAHAQWYAPKEVATPYGPYHARFLQGGEGVIETLVANDPILSANAPWTIHAW